jgi:hypothetical protein
VVNGAAGCAAGAATGAAAAATVVRSCAPDDAAWNMLAEIMTSKGPCAFIGRFMELAALVIVICVFGAASVAEREGIVLFTRMA